MNNHSPIAWLDAFPTLSGINDAAWQRAAAAASILHFAPGEAIFRDGESCQRHLLILSGSVRLHKVTEDGHEIVLEHVGPGQACELTAACLVSGKCYPAAATADTAVAAVAIPQSAFEDALAQSPAFRQFVFSTLDREVLHLISLVEDVAFGHVDCRLCELLLQRADAHGLISITHQELAAELGTAREVISRALKPMEHRGWIKLHRGRIELVNRAPLAELVRRGGM